MAIYGSQKQKAGRPWCVKLSRLEEQGHQFVLTPCKQFSRLHLVDHDEITRLESEALYWEFIATGHSEFNVSREQTACLSVTGISFLSARTCFSSLLNATDVFIFSPSFSIE